MFNDIVTTRIVRERQNALLREAENARKVRGEGTDRFERRGRRQLAQFLRNRQR